MLKNAFYDQNVRGVVTYSIMTGWLVRYKEKLGVTHLALFQLGEARTQMIFTSVTIVMGLYIFTH